MLRCYAYRSSKGQIQRIFYEEPFQRLAKLRIVICHHKSSTRTKKQIAFDMPVSWLTEGGGTDYLATAHAQLTKISKCKKLFVNDLGRAFDNHSLRKWFLKLQKDYGEDLFEHAFPPARLRNVFLTSLNDLHAQHPLAGPSIEEAVKPMATSVKQVHAHYDMHRGEREAYGNIVSLCEYRRRIRGSSASLSAVNDDMRDAASEGDFRVLGVYRVAKDCIN